MGNLATSASPTVTGTLYNTAGLTPGGIFGTPGRTYINGAYNVTSSNAALDIALGGPNQPSSFQPVGAYYDYLDVTGEATVAGALNLSLVNGYVPAAGATFTVMSANSLSGSFSNIRSGTVLSMGGDYFSVYYGTGQPAPIM